jgi:phosphoribosylamine---glycine ligase
MNVLLLGSGGREHAFAWKVAQSKRLTKLFIAPGNAGTESCGTNVSLNPNDFEQVKKFTLENNIEMVIVGPEDPLVRGIYDFFLKDDKLKNIPVIGPSKAGAQLEGSKAFSKKFMMRHHIPTAQYGEFNQQNIEDGFRFIEAMNEPVVLKADGLAAGKGVIIAATKEEAKATLKEMIVEAKFGESSATVVIEEFLKGIEFSVFVLTDRKSYKILPVAKDYKRISEGDTGLNTGGMGAVTPLPFVNDVLMKKVEEKIIKPTLAGLKNENIVYKGFIYFGLIKVGDEPLVIEYNCRMGDPETEVVIPMLENDLLELLAAVGNETLESVSVQIKEGACATVVMVSGGYPGDYEKGKAISGLELVKNSVIFHAGTAKKDGQIVTNGGRVLAITSIGNTLPDALAASRANAEKIQFEGKYFRNDIGFDVTK